MAFNYFSPYPYMQQENMQRLQRMRDEITDQLARMQQQPMPQTYGCTRRNEKTRYDCSV